MVEWIYKRAQGDRTKVGSLAGLVCIICNILLCTTKGAVGLLSGSVSIVADALNNLSDASSNIISVLGFKLASRPADEEHPYGHGRFEYLAGLVVAALVLTIGIELVRTSVDKILNPQPVEFSWALVAALVLSIVVKLWMAAFNKGLGKRIDSETLMATAQDSKNDVVATTAVLITTLIAKYTGINLDAWAGLGVGGYIAWSGIGLIRDTVNPLLGVSPSPELVEHIRSRIMAAPGVLGTHDLMVHDYGPGRQFASAHVEMAAEADPLESHDTIDNIEQAFKEEDGLIVTLHYDPIVTNDPQVANMRANIADAARSIDERLTIHDLRCVPGPTHINVIFDCVRPLEFELTPEELRARMCALVCELYPSAVPKITIDEGYVSAAQ